MAKADSLRRSGAPQHMVSEFLDNGYKLNILRSVQGSIRSAASGINNYLRFCTMADPTAFPPSTGTIRWWSTTFDPGKTFGLYINHVRKAEILLGRYDDWLTPEVRFIAKGLRRAQDKSFAFTNFIMISDVVRIIIDQGRQSNMGTIAYLSYLLPLLVQPGTLQLTIDIQNEIRPTWT